MNVFAEFALTMAFPVASVMLGGWLLWRRVRAQAEAKRLAELDARPVVVHVFRPAYLRDRQKQPAKVIDYDPAYLYRRQSNRRWVLSPEESSIPQDQRCTDAPFDAMVTGDAELKARRHLKPFVIHGMETPPPKVLARLCTTVRNLAMDIDIAARIEIRRLKRWWKRRGTQ